MNAELELRLLENDDAQRVVQKAEAGSLIHQKVLTYLALRRLGASL